MTSYHQVPPPKQFAHNPNVEFPSTEGVTSRGYGGMCVERQQHEPDTSSKRTSPLAFSFVPSRFLLTSTVVVNWASWKLPLTRAAAKCDIPTCSTCEFAKAKCRPTTTKQQLPVSSKTHALKTGSTLPWATGFHGPFHGH